MRLRCLVVLLLVVACSAEPTSVLEAGARFPDDEGVVTEISIERLVLDGERAYRIAADVESFKTRSHEVTQLLSWEGKYVHVGLDEDEAIRWVAGIGTVVQGSEPVVFYSGVFRTVDEQSGRAVFEDGTTLRLGDGLSPPAESTEVVVEIDPARHAAVELTS